MAKTRRRREILSVEQVRAYRDEHEAIATGRLPYWHEGERVTSVVEAAGVAIDVVRVNYGYGQTVHLENTRVIGRCGGLGHERG